MAIMKIIANNLIMIIEYHWSVMGVSLQKVAGLSVVLKVAFSNKNSGKFRQNSGKQSISLISIG